MAKTCFNVERKELVLAVRTPMGRRSLAFVGALGRLGRLSYLESSVPTSSSEIHHGQSVVLVSLGIESSPAGGLTAEEAGFFLPRGLVEL